MCVSSGRVFVRRTNCADVSDRLCLQVVYIQDFPRKDFVPTGPTRLDGSAVSPLPPPNPSSDFEAQLEFVLQKLEVPSGE